MRSSSPVWGRSMRISGTSTSSTRQYNSNIDVTTLIVVLCIERKLKIIVDIKENIVGVFVI